MALINCPECKKQISDKAQNCPSCGYAIGATVVEQTSKKWKGLLLIGAALIVAGLILMIAKYPLAGVTLSGLGLILIFYAKTKSWWHHA